MRPRNHPSRSDASFPLNRARTFLGRAGLIVLGALVALLLLPRMGPVEHESTTVHGTAAPGAVDASTSPTDGPVDVPAKGHTNILEQNILQPGYVMVLASWVCSFPRLDEVNQVSLRIIEPPLTELVDQGDLVGWGQLNGEFRDEYNYHTYYIAESMEAYRQAIGQVLTFMSQEVPDQMNAFYELCSRTRETRVTVVTARP